MRIGNLVQVHECGIFENSYGIIVDIKIFPRIGEEFAEIFINDGTGGDIYPFITHYIKVIR
tara:strand:- start:607 stop:789 length:183 start_codon:yes stop_codon:yes gene_type:complete